MNREVIFTADADADVIGARQWYDAQQPGRGEGFLTELAAHVERVCATPEHYGEVRRGIRAAPLPYSKYIVYYRVNPSQMVVVAVLHERADTRRLRRR